jgi:hypothetical protein
VVLHKKRKRSLGLTVWLAPDLLPSPTGLNRSRDVPQREVSGGECVQMGATCLPRQQEPLNESEDEPEGHIGRTLSTIDDTPACCKVRYPCGHYKRVYPPEIKLLQAW